MSANLDRDILNIDEAAALLGVSVKTFNKVLHSEDLPARKIGREWKFSRRALIEWVGNGRSRAFYRDGTDGTEDAHASERPEREGRNNEGPGRRTAGWRFELD
jgi:excisionase family DNA binding protein